MRQVKGIVCARCNLMKSVTNSGRDGELEASIREVEVTMHRAGREKETYELLKEAGFELGV